MAEPTDLDILRAEMVTADNEIRYEMRDHVSKLDIRTGQLDARLRVMEMPMERLGKLEQKLGEEAQNNINQAIALQAAQEAIVLLNQALIQKDETIAKEAAVASMFQRFLGAIAVALFGAGAAGLMWFLAGENINYWFLNSIIAGTTVASFLVFTGNESVAIDLIKGAGRKLFGS